jgi:glycosyltransferase involved in cell wall biosynthesis
MPDQPPISCLMVALPAVRRFERLKRSINDYLRQTWPVRELLIVLNGGDAAAAASIRAYAAGLGRADIRIVEPAGELPLGALRNIAVAEARSEIVCQWDDDDLYHPDRLERQAAALIERGAEAVCLEQVMQFFPVERRLYCDNFSATGETCFPGSILGCAGAIAYQEAARLGEDSELVFRLKARGGLGTLPGCPHLYVYVSHGANSWTDEHHRSVPRWHGLSVGLLKRREAQLRAGLGPIDFGPGPVTVQGPNGPAFVIGGAHDGPG